MDTQNLVEQTSSNLQASTLKVRCPACFKLFAVNENEISAAKPEFACNKCEQQFWIAYPECRGVDEILGYPLEVKPAEIDTPQPELRREPTFALKKEAHFIEDHELPQLDCPNCESTYVAGDLECGGCGIIFKRYEASHDDNFKTEVPVQASLIKEWRRVMTCYADHSAHQSFVNNCSSLNRLDYAAYKYANQLKVDSGDAVAINMIHQIESLAMVKAGMPLVLEKKAKPSRFRWTFIMMGLGLAMMLIGYFIPQFRNMVGVGVALTFLTLMLRVYFK